MRNQAEVRTWLRHCHSDSDAGHDDLAHILPALVRIQAERATQIARQLRPADKTVVLRDPVGTGKTFMALAAALLLCDDETAISSVIVVAPNEDVKRNWEQRYRTLFGAAGGSSVLKRRVRWHFTTRSVDRLQALRPRAGRCLFIIDEAHRGTQTSSASWVKLDQLNKGQRTLLVTATPFQLSTGSLQRLLQLGGSQRDAQSLDQVTSYGDKLREAKRMLSRSSRPDDEVIRAAVRSAADLHGAARTALVRVMHDEADWEPAHRREHPKDIRAELVPLGDYA